MIVVENNTNSIVTNAMVSHLDGQRQQCQHAAFHAENSYRSNNHGPIRVGNYAVQQPRKGFKGDTDLMVDELISACQKNESQLQDVGDLQKTKKERTLVPFFAGGEAVDGALSSALEWPVGRGNNHHHGMTVKNGRVKAHEKKDDAKRNKKGKKQVTGDANNKPAKAVFQQQGYGKPTHKQGHHEQRQQQKGRYAGPAFTYSSRLFLNFDRGIALASIKSSEWAIHRQTMYICYVLSCHWWRDEEYTHKCKDTSLRKCIG